MARVMMVLLCVLLLAPGADAASAQADTACPLPPLTLPLFDATPPALVAATPSLATRMELSLVEAEDAMDILVACINSSDPRLEWAIFTPRWLAEQFTDSTVHYLPAFEYELADGSAQQRKVLLELESVENIEQLPDGRFTVQVTLVSGDLHWTDTLVLVHIDGYWRIDDVVLDS